MLKTCLYSRLSVCLNTASWSQTVCLLSVTVSLHAWLAHIRTEPAGEYFNSITACRAGAFALSMSTCLFSSVRRVMVRIIPEAVTV